jgi:DUF971 family protein
VGGRVASVLCDSDAAILAAFAFMDAVVAGRYDRWMRPVDLQIIGDELAIKWENQSESYVRLETLRRACPCAGCRGEIDVLGQLHKGPEIPLAPKSFQVTRIAPVGGYAIQPFWADGHSSGLFTFEYLQKVAEPQLGRSEA